MIYALSPCSLVIKFVNCKRKFNLASVWIRISIAPVCVKRELVSSPHPLCQSVEEFELMLNGSFIKSQS